MARKLLIVQIFHTGAEMGSVRETLEGISEKLIGKEGWEAHKKRVAEFWEHMEKLLLERFATTDFCKLKLYQDAQILNGKIGIKMIEDIANMGSRNHQLLLQLIQKGAKLMKTESFELLKEEYMLTKNVLNAKTPEAALIAKNDYKARKDSLLDERDKYIAKNIDRSLKDEEIGIIFIGAIHRIERYLPNDIKIEYLEDEKLKKLKKEILEVIAKTRL
ncbi:MAG: hypothetical protein AB1779_03605 [Candidatus Thermoplasmatota archaeon]